MTSHYTFAEFFSGGGMVRAGLGVNWKCVLANDIDEKKCNSYRNNWPSEHLFQCDISELPKTALMKQTDVYWASSPCQDFSLAGKGLGLEGSKSTAFLPWIEKLSCAVSMGYAPKIVAFENVVGLLSANNGQDFTTVISAISRQGYRVGAVIIDAKSFVPHSRPRLFVIGVRDDIRLPKKLIGELATCNSDRIKKAFLRLEFVSQEKWIWWNIQLTQQSSEKLASIVEWDIPESGWYSSDKTSKLIEMMSTLNREKLAQAQGMNQPIVGTIYKRGRPNQFGKIVQMAELRLDGIAGCLRTPAGGSSRQTVLFIDGKSVRARLLTILEAARLMGLPSSYRMPENYNEAYRLAGDGVVVPVVDFIRMAIFEPILKEQHLLKAA